MAQKFRENGATSAERAMTSHELGLPPRFEEAMKRRLGQTGIFVDVGGRYYLNEGRLREVEERRRDGGGSFGGMAAARHNRIALRITRMILGIFILGLIVVNWSTGRSTILWFVILVLVVAWIAITVVQIFQLTGTRGRMSSPGY
jgi:hypothetical protein